MLSIVVPCYNEEQRLPRTIEHITAEANRVVVESHNAVGNHGFQVFEFEDGKVKRWRTYEDTAYMNTFRREGIEYVQGRPSP